MARATVAEMPRVPRRLALGVLLGALVGGCLSPTLPLPPPTKPDIEGPDQRGLVTLTGTLPHAPAHARAFNFPNSVSVLTGEDGAYALVLAAAENDEIQFWYEIGNQRSPSIVFRIPPLRDGGAPSDSAEAGGDDAGADGSSSPAPDGGDGG